MSRRKKASTIDLTLGQPSAEPDPILMERALAAYYKGAKGYTENAGLSELRALIGSHYGRSMEEVLVTVGSEEAVYLAFSTLLNPGDEVLIPVPGYPAYPGIVKMMGGVAVPYPIEANQGRKPSWAVIEPFVSPRTKVILWNAPSNPFGTIPDKVCTEQVVEEAAKQNIVVMSDEIYRDLVYEDFEFAAPVGSHVVTVGGLSKSCALTGFRLGFLLAPAEFVKRATLVHQLMVTCAPRLSQLFAVEVFCRPEVLKAHLPLYRAARKALREGASQLPDHVGLSLGEGAFYATLEFEDTEQDSLALAVQAVEQADVAVVPAEAFGGRGFWRLSYAAGAEAAAEGLRRLGSFLHSAKKRL